MDSPLISTELGFIIIGAFMIIMFVISFIHDSYIRPMRLLWDLDERIRLKIPIIAGILSFIIMKLFDFNLWSDKIVDSFIVGAGFAWILVWSKSIKDNEQL